MTTTEVKKFLDTSAVIEAVASAFVATVTKAQQERGTAKVVLTGGGAGIGLLEYLRNSATTIDWSALDIYWGDERFLPSGHKDRNEVQAYDALLSHVPISPERVHPMPANEGIFHNNPSTAAQAYEELLHKQGLGKHTPFFDIHLLGMGSEGHINSLFPQTLEVQEKSKNVVAVMDSPKPPAQRITLTLPTVRQARQVWLLVTGRAKAEAVAACLAGATAEDFPAAGAAGLETTIWFVDHDAASTLP
ncbi:MAG: 6-phosphogluconolactonase [Mycobacteriaceae bacterium]